MRRWLRYMRYRLQGKSRYEATVLADGPIFFSGQLDEVEMNPSKTITEHYNTESRPE